MVLAFAKNYASTMSKNHDVLVHLLKMSIKCKIIILIRDSKDLFPKAQT